MMAMNEEMQLTQVSNLGNFYVCEQTKTKNNNKEKNI